MHNYYICSYGGSGSKTLTKYLKNYGNVYHIHSRNPPEYLTKAGNNYKKIKNEYVEWFSENLIPNDKLKDCTVIFIYRNPADSILSRFNNSDHLINIQTNPSIKIEDVINKKKDLYGIEEFFDNYVLKKKKYDVICVKFEDFIENIEKINKILNIKGNPEFYPKRKKMVGNKKNPTKIKLEKIYEKVKEKMDKYDSIFINNKQ